MPITSIVPIARLSAAWRSARWRTELSRLRQRAASSKRCASAAAFIFASSCRRIGLRLAAEELDDPVDDPAVVLLGHVADARREAALDVEVEARNPGVAARLRPLAGPVGEGAVQDVERLAHLLRVGVRAEVDDAAPVPLAREHDPRELVLDGHGDVRVRLVVAQADVERRPVPADQVLLQVERLRLGRGDDDLDPLHPLDHLLEPEARVAGAEVRADARAQRLRLADVHDLVPRAAEEVDAGLRGQRLELRLDALLAGLIDRFGHARGA